MSVQSDPPVATLALCQRAAASLLRVLDPRDDIYAQRWDDQYDVDRRNAWRERKLVELNPDPTVPKKLQKAISKAKLKAYRPINQPWRAGFPTTRVRPTAETLRAHVEGRETHGFYPLFNDSTTGTIGVDFDNHRGEVIVDADPRADYDALVALLDARGIPYLGTHSRGGGGYWVWLLLPGRIQARAARAVLHGLLHIAGVKKIDAGGTFDALFPKQDFSSSVAETPSKYPGNLYCVPLSLRWLNAETPGGYFVGTDPRDLEAQVAHLEAAERIAPDAWAALCAEFPPAETPPPRPPRKPRARLKPMREPGDESESEGEEPAGAENDDEDAWSDEEHAGPSIAEWQVSAWEIALRRSQRLGEPLDAGKFAVLCVNDAQHSDPVGTADQADSSCVLFPPSDELNLGFPWCAHAHCANLTLRDWIAAVGQDVWRAACETAREPSQLPRLPAPRPSRALDPDALAVLASDLGHALAALADPGAVHPALAGSLYARGVPLEHGPDLARAVADAAGDPDDHADVWRGVADKVAAGLPAEGYRTLRTRWPGVADVVDAALPAGGGAQATRDELDALGVPPQVPAVEAAALIRRAIRDAPAGPTVVRVTEGAGKTSAGTDVAIARARACAAPRVPSRDRTALVVQTHAVARVVVAKLEAAGVIATYRRSVTAGRDPDGAPSCAYHVPVAALVRGGHSAVATCCEGVGMGPNGRTAPCDRRDTCSAFAGRETLINHVPDYSARVFVTVHALLHEALEFLGDEGLLLLDESPEVVTPHALSRDDLQRAALAEGFTPKEAYRAPVLLAFAEGMERGETVVTGCAMVATFERGVAAKRGDLGWEAETLAAYGSLDPAVILQAYAQRVAYRQKRDPNGEPVGWIRRGAWAPNLTAAARHRAMSTGAVDPALDHASRTHALLARALAGVVRAVPDGATPHAERAVVHVEDEVPARDPDAAPDDPTPLPYRVLRLVLAAPAVADALRRDGPTVLLDATADLAVLGVVAGVAKDAPPIPCVDVRVADGAPVHRAIFSYSGGSRRKALSRGKLRFPASKSGGLVGFPRYLAAALAKILRHAAGTPLRLAIYTWMSLRAQLEAAWGRAPGHDPRIAALLEPLRARGAVLRFGHYGDLRGKDDWKGCDAYLSLGDARPNVGQTRAVARVLDLLVEHDAIYRRATAAEASQAGGRMRAPWLTAPTIHVHVGTVAPLGWDARAEVLELPRGRLDVRDPFVVEEAIRVHGSQRLAGIAWGLRGRLRPSRASDPTPRREEEHVTSTASTGVGVSKPVEKPLTGFETPHPTGPISDDFLSRDHAQTYVRILGGVRKTATYLGLTQRVVMDFRRGTTRMPRDVADVLLSHIEAQRATAPRRHASPAAGAAPHSGASPPA